MKEILITIAITWAVRTLADIGVKYSKRTENTIDDIIFNNLKELTTGMTSATKKGLTGIINKLKK